MSKPHRSILAWVVITCVVMLALAVSVGWYALTAADDNASPRGENAHGTVKTRSADKPAKQRHDANTAASEDSAHKSKTGERRASPPIAWSDGAKSKPSRKSGESTNWEPVSRDDSGKDVHAKNTTKADSEVDPSEEPENGILEVTLYRGAWDSGGETTVKPFFDGTLYIKGGDSSLDSWLEESYDDGLQSQWKFEFSLPAGRYEYAAHDRRTTEDAKWQAYRIVVAREEADRANWYERLYKCAAEDQARLQAYVKEKERAAREGSPPPPPPCPSPPPAPPCPPLPPLPPPPPPRPPLVWADVWLKIAGDFTINTGEVTRLEIRPRALRVEDATVHVRLPDGTECDTLSHYRYSFEQVPGGAHAASDLMGELDIAHGFCTDGRRSRHPPLRIPVVGGFITCVQGRRFGGAWSDTLRILPGTKECTLEVRDGESGPAVSYIVRLPAAPPGMEGVDVKLCQWHGDETGDRLEYDAVLGFEPVDLNWIDAPCRTTFVLTGPVANYIYPSSVLSRITIDIKTEGQVVELPPIEPPVSLDKRPGAKARIIMTCGGTKLGKLEADYVWPDGERESATLLYGEIREKADRLYPVAVVDGDQTIPVEIHSPLTWSGTATCIIALEPRVKMRVTLGGKLLNDFEGYLDFASGRSSAMSSGGYCNLWAPPGEASVNIWAFGRDNDNISSKEIGWIVRGQTQRVDFSPQGAAVTFTHDPQYDETPDHGMRWDITDITSKGLAAMADDVLDREHSTLFLEPGVYRIEPHPLRGADDIIILKITDNEDREVHLPWLGDYAHSGQALFNMPQEILDQERLEGGSCDTEHMRLSHYPSARPMDDPELEQDIRRVQDVTFHITPEGLLASELPRGTGIYLRGQIICGEQRWLTRPVPFTIGNTGITKVTVQWQQVEECVPVHDELKAVIEHSEWRFEETGRIPNIRLEHWFWNSAESPDKFYEIAQRREGDYAPRVLPGVYHLKLWCTESSEWELLAATTLTVSPGDAFVEIPYDLRVKLVALGWTPE